MNINKVIFLVVSIAIFLSCIQDNKNVNLLLSENDRLNRAFKDKDWEIVYSLKLESEKYGIGLEYWSKKWDKNTFIQE